MMNGKRFAISLLLAAALGLAGCDTAEERAEEHYQRATALLDEGRVEQAIVEFRNVFQLNGQHAAARLDYANLMVDEGRTEEAIGQFLRLVEQDWSNVAGHKRLADLALSVQDFTTARTHAERAYELDPTDPEIRAIKATFDYRDGEREVAVRAAREVLEDAPTNVAAQMVLIAERMDAGDSRAALDLAEAALADAPRDAAVHLVKLAVLERLGDRAAVGDQLLRMTELFPDDDGATRALIRWHLEAGDLDAAEPLLRARAETAAPGSPERIAADLGLVQVFLEIRGAASALAELDRLATAAEDPAPYLRARAGIEVSEGRIEDGIATLRAVIADSEPSDQRRDAQIALARILAETGEGEESEGLVEAVLAEDASHVEALKLRARRMIATDRTTTAIRDLRTALNQAPQDAETLTLMAMAHEREGDRPLAGERLALALEASNHAPAEAIRYAQFLMQDGRAGPAEAALVEALRRRPTDPELLTALGQLYASRGDWTRADEMAARLGALDDPGAATRAAALQARILSGQERFDETIAMLQGLSATAGGAEAALAGTVQTYVRADNLEGAQTYLTGVLERDPEAALPRLMLAGIAALRGETAEAEAAYRALIADHRDYAPAHEGLYLLLAGSGQSAAAAEALETGLEATREVAPETGPAPRLLFLKAGQLEAEGDFEGTIAIYETLYAQDSASPIIANNLASLLSSHREDAESHERAFTIARRLRGSDMPHFQDTYGWILAQRGAHEEALPYLEQAAAGLPGDPLVIYHLGATQAALGQADAARASLERALAAAGPTTPEAAMADARRLLDTLAAAPTTAPGEQAAGEAP